MLAPVLTGSGGTALGVGGKGRAIKSLAAWKASGIDGTKSFHSQELEVVPSAG